MLVLSSSGADVSMMSRSSYGEALSPSMLKVSRGGREMTPEEALRDENRRLLQILIKTREQVRNSALDGSSTSNSPLLVAVCMRWCSADPLTAFSCRSTCLGCGRKS